MDWLTTARELPQNHKARIDCAECSEGSGKNKAMISHSSKKYSAYCFCCGWNPFHMKGELSIKELARIKELNENARRSYRPVTLPRDYTTEIPIEGRLWLYKAGITESIWKAHNIGFSESLQRVILPVYDKGTVVWWQGRGILAGQTPKYLQPSNDKSHIIYTVTPDVGNTQEAVVVEDILSAIRVGTHKTTYSILGTKLSSYQANVLGRHEKVSTWLDPDGAGIRGAASIRKALGMVTSVRNITSDVDPKFMTDQQIQDKLNETDNKRPQKRSVTSKKTDRCTL